MQHAALHMRVDLGDEGGNHQRRRDLNTGVVVIKNLTLRVHVSNNWVLRVLVIVIIVQVLVSI